MRYTGKRRRRWGFWLAVGVCVDPDGMGPGVAHE